jgi:DNA-directed RNA polymerase specialized sigma24 family protein
MSTATRKDGGRPAEQRAEELMQRVANDVSRFATRMLARAREEAEDIVAEAQTVRRGTGPLGRSGS